MYKSIKQSGNRRVT